MPFLWETPLRLCLTPELSLLQGIESCMPIKHSPPPQLVRRAEGLVPKQSPQAKALLCFGGISTPRSLFLSLGGKRRGTATWKAESGWDVASSYPFIGFRVVPNGIRRSLRGEHWPRCHPGWLSHVEYHRCLGSDSWSPSFIALWMDVSTPVWLSPRISLIGHS